MLLVGGNWVWYKGEQPSRLRSPPMLQSGAGKMRLTWAHEAIVAIVRSLPLPLGVLALRGYNRSLRSFRREYVGTTYFGGHIYRALHDMIQSYIFHLGVWEPDISHVIQDNLSPGDVFVDIGANVATIHCLDRGVLDQRAGLSRLKLRRAILCCFSEIYLLMNAPVMTVQSK